MWRYRWCRQETPFDGKLSTIRLANSMLNLVVLWMLDDVHHVRLLSIFGLLLHDSLIVVAIAIAIAIATNYDSSSGRRGREDRIGGDGGVGGLYTAGG